jgi:hypothetical protein
VLECLKTADRAAELLPLTRMCKGEIESAASSTRHLDSQEDDRHGAGTAKGCCIETFMGRGGPGTRQMYGA